MDALSNKAAELNESRSKLGMQALIEEDRMSKQQLNSDNKPELSSAPLSHAAGRDDSGMTKIISMLTALEESNAKLQESNAKFQERLTTMEEGNSELRQSNDQQEKRLATVEESNIQLRQSNEQLEATLLTTMEAVLGVSDIIRAQFLAGLLVLMFRIALR